MPLNNLVKEIVITDMQIKERVKEMANAISNYYQNIKKPLVLIGILRGCINFLKDLMTELTIDCNIDFLYATSYNGNIMPGKLDFKFDITYEIKNRDVLIVDDIIDSGHSLLTIFNHLQQKQPKTLKVATFLDKKSKRVVDINADWTGFEVPDYFLIGYGLDYQETQRNLPFVAIANLEKIKTIVPKK